MHFQIFIPQKTGANPQHLRDVGLEELLRDVDRGPLAMDQCGAGPDGSLGTVFWWEPNARPGYKPDAQNWTPAKPDPKRKLAAGRFWIGIDRVSPPTPEDLRRDGAAFLDGLETKLGDGNAWIAPNVMKLPIRFALDEAGELTSLPKRDVAPIHDRCLWAFGKLEAFYREGAAITHAEAVAYCAEMLSVNYRVNAEICHLLELFDEGNVELLMLRTTDVRKILAIEGDLKKKAAERAAAASGPSGSDT